MSFIDKGNKLLVFKYVIAAMPMVIHPPKTTAGTVRISFAVKPDSKAPISFDDPINMLFTAETRPRI